MMHFLASTGISSVGALLAGILAGVIVILTMPILFCLTFYGSLRRRGVSPSCILKVIWASLIGIAIVTLLFIYWF